MAALKGMWPSFRPTSHTAVTTRRIVQAEILLLCLVLATFAWFAVMVYRSPYLPSSSANDGFGYFVQAKSFYLNHTLRGALLHYNFVSPVGEFYSHGFAYALIDGAVALIVGWHDKLIIAIDIAMIAGAALFIVTRRDPWSWKLALVLLFLTYFLTLTMTFAYMQEAVQLLLGVLLGFLLMRIIDSEDGERAWALILCYLIAVAAAALMRATWVFWVFGLLALVKSRRDFAAFGFLALAYLILGYLFKKLFYAPYPFFDPYGPAAAALADHRAFDAARAAFGYMAYNFGKLFINVYYVFGTTWIPNIWMMLMIGITGYLGTRFIAFRDRHALAVAVIGAVYVAALLVTYDALTGPRIVGPVFVLQLVYLVKTRHLRLVAGILACQLLAFPGVVAITANIVDFQTKAGAYAIENREQLRAVDDLAGAINLGRPATIYVDNAFHHTQYPLTIHLPLTSADGQPLRYSQDLLATLPMPQRVFDRSFIDFVLSKAAIGRADLKLVYQAHELYLYRLE
jgi:hypothetical protein